MTDENIKKNLEIEHFRELNKALDNSISHSFSEWKKTKSCEELRKEFKNNSRIITTMTKLKIGI
jgi:hypothetical protein